MNVIYIATSNRGKLRDFAAAAEIEELHGGHAGVAGPEHGHLDAAVVDSVCADESRHGLGSCNYSTVPAAP